MKGVSSQEFVPIKSINGGVASLSETEHFSILHVDSVNLSLKSEDEQEAVLREFQNFFNSLDFPVQIFCKSRRINIDKYLESLRERASLVQNDLLKLQIVEYIEYIKAFTSQNSIMSKEFFIIVPYTSAAAEKILKDPADKEFAGVSPKTKQQLEDRVYMVKSGIGRCGLKTFTLSDENMLSLYKELLNPGPESKTIF